ncbi:MAG: ABC transporter ATP-binding protein [Candidatus Heimdallarchaeota archaeon]
MANDKQKPIIEFVNVSKKYKEVEALIDVSFEINKGDIFGYIGHNGAGKTTTLKILVGLIRDYSGEVLIAGESLQSYTDFSNLIGYLPQDVGFQEWRTVDHALMTFGLLSGMQKSDLKQRIPEILENVGLTEVRHRKIKYLSGGMQQKLKLAQALLHDPQVLILDEPMSGLDPTSRFQMKKIIRTIIKEGVIQRIGSPFELQNELTEGDAIELIGNNLEASIAKIKALPNVEQVELASNSHDRLVVTYSTETNVQEAIIQLMAFLSENKIAIQNFNYLKPSLEQVYLKYMEGGPTQ